MSIMIKTKYYKNNYESSGAREEVSGNTVQSFVKPYGGTEYKADTIESARAFREVMEGGEVISAAEYKELDKVPV
tara:strand:- start:297 stop:521 length:225 start_codon:yes stop_codon:yes gene_type:complete